MGQGTEHQEVRAPVFQIPVSESETSALLQVLPWAVRMLIPAQHSNSDPCGLWVDGGTAKLWETGK